MNKVPEALADWLSSQSETELSRKERAGGYMILKEPQVRHLARGTRSSQEDQIEGQVTSFPELSELCLRCYICYRESFQNFLQITGRHGVSPVCGECRPALHPICPRSGVG